LSPKPAKLQIMRAIQVGYAVAIILAAGGVVLVLVALLR
jgi:hypothetical protein